MTNRICAYATCGRPVTGKPEKIYCCDTCRRHYDAAVKFYGSMTAKGGAPFRDMICRIYDEHRAAKTAAATGRTVT